MEPLLLHALRAALAVRAPPPYGFAAAARRSAPVAPRPPGGGRVGRVGSGCGRSWPRTLPALRGPGFARTLRRTGGAHGARVSHARNPRPVYAEHSLQGRPPRCARLPSAVRFPFDALRLLRASVRPSPFPPIAAAPCIAPRRGDAGSRHLLAHMPRRPRRASRGIRRATSTRSRTRLLNVTPACGALRPRGRKRSRFSLAAEEGGAAEGKTRKGSLFRRAPSVRL